MTELESKVVCEVKAWSCCVCLIVLGAVVQNLMDGWLVELNQDAQRQHQARRRVLMHACAYRHA